MKLTEEGRKELRREFEKFMEVPFPGLRSADFTAEAKRSGAAHLHLNLVEYDSHVAGLAALLFRHGQDVDRGLLPTNENLKSDFEEFGKQNPAARIFIEEHPDYLESVHRLVRLSKDRAVNG